MPPQNLSLSDVARQLLDNAESGVLSTITRDDEGYPFTSLVQFALDEQGAPILLLSELAEHTKNLRKSSKASLFVRDDRSGEPQATARVTVIGDIRPLAAEDSTIARERFLARHPHAAVWSSFGDFHWYRLSPQSIYVVGGFGRMGWLETKPTTPEADHDR